MQPHQVLVNLPSNAAKAATEGGRISTGVRRQGEPVVASVRGNGVGMPPEARERLFERYRGGAAGYRRGPGSGLCISKGTVDAHEGRIWFRSAPGQGTTFWFSLPAMA